MIRAVTMTHQCGSGGTKLARLVADKLGWDVVDRRLTNRVGRVADLPASTAHRFDEEAARWCDALTTRGINLSGRYPSITPRWFGEIDDDSMHALTTELTRAAADLGACVIVVPGAQCLLQSCADVFKVLVYAPIEQRVAAVQRRHPECADAKALVRKRDLQTAKYTLEHYGNEWLGAGLYLYDLCVNTATGLDAAAELINANLMFAEESCTQTAQNESWPC